MKYILTIFLFSFSLIAQAKIGDMGGGRSMFKKNILALSNSSIEAVVSKSGVYARLIDLQEGFEHFEGVKVTPTETLINFNKPALLDAESVILNDGRELQIQIFRAMVSGGDMGGG